MDGDFAEFRHEMRAGLAEVCEETRARLAEVRAQIDAVQLRLEATIERRFNDMIRWSLLFWLSGLGAVVALLRLT